VQVRLNYREPGITECEPAGLDNLTEREPNLPMIARPTADKCKPLQVCLQQPEHLTALEPQQLRRRLRRQPFLIQIPQHLEPRQLPIAQSIERSPQTPPGKSAGSVISNWHRGVISMLRLHLDVGYGNYGKFKPLQSREAHCVQPERCRTKVLPVKAARSTMQRCAPKRGALPLARSPEYLSQDDFRL
jgi:hypothetical protein